MANRQRAEARRKAAAKAANGGGSKSWMWITIGIVVVLAVGGIIWASSGSDNNAASNSTDPTATDGGTSNLPVSQPVVVTGDALPAYVTGANPDTAVGKAAPALDGFNFLGAPVKVDASATGRPYMLVYLAHWCPHCNAEIPRLLNWKHSGQVPANLDVFGVATAVSPTSVNFPPGKWFSDKGWDWPVMVDESQGDGAAGTAAQAYGATGWPYIVIVGADGTVKARLSGEVQISDLQKVVDQALA